MELISAKYRLCEGTDEVLKASLSDEYLPLINCYWGIAIKLLQPFIFISVRPIGTACLLVRLRAGVNITLSEWYDYYKSFIDRCCCLYYWRVEQRAAAVDRLISREEIAVKQIWRHCNSSTFWLHCYVCLRNEKRGVPAMNKEDSLCLVLV